MSSVLPAKSTRVGALDSMIIGKSQPDFGFFGRGSLTEPRGKLKEERGGVNRKVMPASAGRVRLASGGRAVTRDELRAVGLFHGERGVGLKAAAAASFIRSHSADDDQLIAFHQALGVNGGIATTNADGQQLGDFFGDGQETRHGLERAPAVVGVQAGDDDALAKIGEPGANIDHFIAKKLRLVDAHDFRARSQFVHDFLGLADVVRGNAQAGMRDDLVGGVALIDGGLENLYALARNLRAAKAANQLLALARKHRADDDFDPAHIAFDDVHGGSLLVFSRHSSVSTPKQTLFQDALRKPNLTPPPLRRGTSFDYRTEQRQQSRQSKTLPAD